MEQNLVKKKVGEMMRFITGANGGENMIIGKSAAAQVEDLEVSDITPYLEPYFNEEDRDMWGLE